MGDEPCRGCTSTGITMLDWLIGLPFGMVDDSQPSENWRCISERFGEIAEKIIELYWPQTAHWPQADTELAQSNRGQAEIVGEIRAFRSLSDQGRGAPLHYARAADPDLWIGRVMREVNPQ